jgi:hypothetical protein
MVDQTYVVYFKALGMATQHVFASTFEIHDERMVFLDSKDRLAGIFLLARVQGWNSATKWPQRRSRHPSNRTVSSSREMRARRCGPDEIIPNLQREMGKCFV